MTLENSPEQSLLPMELPSMSSAAGSRAKMFPSLASALALKVRGLVSGRNTGALLAKYDPASSSWRTFQACLVSGWQLFSESFPRSGSMRSGTVSQLAPSAPLTDEIGSGLLPTPVASSYGTNQGGGAGRVGPVRPSLDTMARHGLWPTPDTVNRKSGRAMMASTNNGRRSGGGQSSPPGLEQAVELSMGVLPRELPSFDALPPRTRSMWPTPASRDFRHPNATPYSERGGGKKGEQLPNAVGGALNPTWVEWLMGFPEGWTDLEHSETP